jgi:hypothetical protein
VSGDPDLDAMAEAFDRGDYAGVRRLAQRVEAGKGDDEVKQAARAILERTKTDPLAIWLLGITAVLLVTLTAWWWRFNGPGKVPPRPPVIEHIH